MTAPTGKGRGGKRPGAGRPEGARNALPSGTVGALNAAFLAQKRLGSGGDPESLAALRRVYERIGDVLEENITVPAMAGAVLKAAETIADTVAGPMVQKHVVAVEHNDDDLARDIERDREGTHGAAAAAEGTAVDSAAAEAPGKAD